MRYADNFCTYEEKFDPHRYVYSGKCLKCKNVITVEIPAEALHNYRQGKHIQYAMPMLSRNNREFLISGYCGKCFNHVFKQTDE